uniref:V-type ATP synthase subunit D n=1 Tax=uncultured Draconibacterium sp. TaxID=1573823 RepID=UPI0032176818
MAIKFQYNKTALQSLNKQLAMRTKALPTIKNKEAALRLEVKKAKHQADELEIRLNEKINSGNIHPRLWAEFLPGLISIRSLKTTTKKIAGVKIPELETISFNEEEYSLFGKPQWFPQGIAFLKELSKIIVEKEICVRKMNMLNHARRKTTQKVNLYEKVQIPGYQNAILKIKRFLEDEENLSISAQKIVKKRQQLAEEEVA